MVCMSPFPLARPTLSAKVNSSIIAWGRYGYYDKMSEGKTIVVFIREDSNPDKSFITCEINPKNGCIAQFFKAYNEYPRHDEQAKQFYNDYQRLLRQRFTY